MKKIFVVIPAFNEEKIIGKVISDIKKEGFKNIIVVDDGSTDQTFKIAKKAKAIVLRHFFNRGKGAAVKTGLELAKKLEAYYVVTLDGDGQHNVKDIKKMIKKLDEGYEVVLGSRFLNKKIKMPFLNRLGNFFANIFTFLIYGLYVNDSQSGFRGYNRKALSLIDTSSNEYEFESEVIKEIAKNNLRYFEMPIDVFYTPYSQSKKKRQNLVNGVITLIKMMIK